MYTITLHVPIYNKECGVTQNSIQCSHYFLSLDGPYIKLGEQGDDGLIPLSNVLGIVKTVSNEAM